MTKEEAVIKLFIEKMKTILKSNGYRTDLGLNVYDWGDRIQAREDMPVAIVQDISGVPEAASDLDIVFDRESLTLQINFGCQEEAETASYLRQAKADIYQMIGANEEEFRTKFNPDTVFSRGDWAKTVEKDTGRTTGAVSLNIIVSYTTNRWLIGEPEY